LSCLGLRDKANIKSGQPNLERYHSAGFETSDVSLEKTKSTFIVLVTGMGVSETIHISILMAFLNLIYLIQCRNSLKIQDTTRVAGTPKTTTPLI
jgi:hypothetical protein